MFKKRPFVIQKRKRKNQTLEHAEELSKILLKRQEDGIGASAVENRMFRKLIRQLAALTTDIHIFRNNQCVPLPPNTTYHHAQELHDLITRWWNKKNWDIPMDGSMSVTYLKWYVTAFHSDNPQLLKELAYILKKEREL